MKHTHEKLANTGFVCAHINCNAMQWEKKWWNFSCYLCALIVCYDGTIDETGDDTNKIETKIEFKQKRDKKKYSKNTRQQ